MKQEAAARTGSGGTKIQPQDQIQVFQINPIINLYNISSLICVLFFVLCFFVFLQWQSVVARLVETATPTALTNAFLNNLIEVYLNHSFQTKCFVF
jgi:flagellar biogenesis protein FliO